MIQKIINILIVLLFILFAIVQLNDPDAALWGGIYLFVAGVAGFAIQQKYSILILITALVLGTIGLIYLAPATYEAIVQYDSTRPTDPTITHTDNVHTEAIKEFFGLLVALIALGWYYSQAKKMKPQKR